jgi:site-specific DNA recombinase
MPGGQNGKQRYRQTAKLEVQIDRYLAAIGESDDPVKGIVERLNKLEAERAALAEKLRLISAEGNVVTLHPAAIDRFASNITALHHALTQAGGDHAAVASNRAAFRNVFESFAVHPTAKRHPYEVTPYARLSAIMGIELFPPVRSPEEMLAEQRVTMSFAATETTSTL